MNTEWVVIISVIAVIVIFGSAKLPQFMRGMGQGIREFKDAVKDTDEHSKTETLSKTDDTE